MLKVFSTASFCQVFMWNKFRMAVFYYFFWWIMKWFTAFKTISHFERTRYFFSTKFQQPGPRFIDLAWSKEWGNHGVSENVWIQKSYIWIEFMNSVRQKDLPSAVIYDFWISNKVENANWRWWMKPFFELSARQWFHVNSRATLESVIFFIIKEWLKVLPLHQNKHSEKQRSFFSSYRMYFWHWHIYEEMIERKNKEWFLVKNN